MHPELSFKEFETMKFIAGVLKEKGICFRDGICNTGIVAEIKGQNPESKTIALRADIDALPILETNDAVYRSKNDGVMHACGHDVHTSCVLGAACILNELRENLKGTIRILFQPGEENLPGGASLMIKEGVLENPTPKSIFGQHVFPELPAGKVGFKPGLYMASADEIYITINGKGGHAAMPHKAVDPITIAAQLITGFQQVISRKNNATTPSVLTFGAVHGGFATNVIPDKVELMGTFRTFDETWRYQAHDWIRNHAKGVCESFGANVEVEIKIGYPHLKNHLALTERSMKVAKEFLGDENVLELDLRMTAEDFAYYTHVCDGCFYRLGTASPDGNHSHPVHNSSFDIDENALETGVGLMAFIAIKQ